MKMWKVHHPSTRLITESTNYQFPGPTDSLPSQSLPATFRNKLKIYQWNADGIPPKFVELCDRLINSDFNILAIHVSKLWETDKTSFIKDYATVRKDWNNILGGGILIFIRTDIVFEKLHSFEKAGMEILSILPKTTKSTWLELYSIYLPDSSSQYNSFDLSLIKPGPSSLILWWP